MTDTVAWLDCSSGISGDMLLGALQSLGAVDVHEVARALPVDVDVEVSDVRRAGLAATRVHVQPAVDQPHRRLAEVLAIVHRTELDNVVRQSASRVFERLARAEGAVHGVAPETVEFHEVGALDAIIDVVAGCVGLHALAADAIVVSPIALGAGTTRSHHGVLPVPAPAVLALLADSDLVAYGGEADVELATPTGVAIAAAFANGSGPMPAMSVTKIGLGAGGRDRPQQPNVLRLVTGEATTAPPGPEWRLLDANVDDLDPRLWPVVLERLLSAGAADAWLTPIVMKKGRPAHTL
ncbi:MAG TPA: nickel pincer cofactor biosynthesis protein LarC, partial [Mycobacteriales bacterium]|nr:nickel pincer cofactor biosynthesis protein LarC [Mycobacteriales bacterium]